jgi:hypothetical protein
VLCKHEVTGSIPVSSTKTHSLFPVRRRFFLKATPTQKQVSGLESSDSAAFDMFQEPQGSASQKAEKHGCLTTIGLGNAFGEVGRPPRGAR